MFAVLTPTGLPSSIVELLEDGWPIGLERAVLKPEDAVTITKACDKRGARIVVRQQDH